MLNFAGIYSEGITTSVDKFIDSLVDIFWADGGVSYSRMPEVQVFLMLKPRKSIIASEVSCASVRKVSLFKFASEVSCASVRKVSLFKCSKLSVIR